MRLALPLLFACGSAGTRLVATPPRHQVDAFPQIPSTGWCRRPQVASPTATRHLEIDPATWDARPFRANGFPSETIALSRHDVRHPSDAGRVVTVAGGTLRLSTWPTSCRETAYGCYAGYWEAPSTVELAEPVPAGACVSFAIEMPGGMVVGLVTGTTGELRGYIHDGVTGALSSGPRVHTTALEFVDVLDVGASPVRAILQEATGPMWVVRWPDATQPIEVVPGPTLTARTLAIGPADSGGLIAITTAGIVALDTATLAPSWHVDGEMWSVLSQYRPAQIVALAVERIADTARVVLHVIDDSGHVLRTVPVYSGPVATVELGRSDGIFVVHLATSP